MKALDPLPLDHISLNVAAAGRRDVFRLLADKAASESGISPHECVEALVSREKLGSTAVGRGIAFPHAQIKELAAPFIYLATLANPVDFRADDKQLVDIVLAALVPEGFAEEQVNLVSRYVRLLRDDARLRRLRNVDTPREAQLALEA